MDEELKKLLKQNLELTEETHKMVKSIRNYVIGQRIWFFIKLLLIIVPLVVGFIYLPPLLQSLTDQYQGLMGGIGNIGEMGADLDNLLK